MSKKITDDQVRELGAKYGLTYARVKMIMEVEGAGKGFSDVTGKILIQFEPAWFKRLYTEWMNNQGTWINNGVRSQPEEWKAFNDAFSKDPEAAMKATSIGNMQVMGFHYKSLGFKTVGEMWDFAKESEANQLELGLRFIKQYPKLYKAVLELDYYHIAYYYNGAGFMELAKRERSVPYDKRLEVAYNKYD